MFSGQEASLCKLTSAKEQMKRQIQPILNSFRACYNDKERGRIAILQQPHNFLRNRCDHIHRDLGYNARIIAASWNPAMISSASPWAQSDGRYNVLVVRKDDVVVIVDLLCCNFLNCAFQVDLCFLDVYQVRSIAPPTLICPYSKIQESKQVLIEKLLSNKAFHDIVQESLDCQAVCDIKRTNFSKNRCETIGICSAATHFITQHWEEHHLGQDYIVTLLTGECNPAAVTEEYFKNWTGTSHNWLRTRSKHSLETVEFDHTFMQFLGTPHDATLAIYFLDVGQMRSVGLTVEEMCKDGLGR